MITLDELEQMIERLPELYKKYGRKPDVGAHKGCDCYACALEIIALELGYDQWQDVLTEPSAPNWQREEELDVFWETFDGYDVGIPTPPPNIARVIKLAKRAREVVGL